MPTIEYVTRNFTPASLRRIEQANEIVNEYAAQGFDLTLRQLYYQFVSRGLIPNRQSEYKRLGDLVNEGRLAGLIDWERIVDRTRFLRSLAHWDDPAEIVRASAEQFRHDKWAKQPTRPEVWIEKDALVGVIEGVCEGLDVAYFAARGYNSSSAQWAAAQRIEGYLDADQDVTIFHLGDHDPSGIDMSRDLTDRLELFLEGDGYDLQRVNVVRVALNFDQVQQYNPPPNPVKETDSRHTGYRAAHGDDCWELDALEPTVIADLIREAIEGLQEPELWDEAIEAEETARGELQSVARQWPQVIAGLNGEGSR
jgi:hypothetical protein